MADKSRKTFIIAHCSQARLIGAFPDYETKKSTVFIDAYGNQVGEYSGHPGKYSGEAINLLAQFAEAAGYSWELHEVKLVDENWIMIDNDIYLTTKVSPRKTKIQVTSNNTLEADHYEIVDKIVKNLAMAGIATLDGECHITITTRC